MVALEAYYIKDQILLHLGQLLHLGLQHQSRGFKEYL